MPLKESYSNQYILTLYCIKIKVCENYNARSNNSKIRLQMEITLLFEKRAVNGNSAKKRAGSETTSSPANGNGKPEFENGATLLCINQFLTTPKVATFRCASTFLDL